jgi:hypothetical protein
MMQVVLCALVLPSAAYAANVQNCHVNGSGPCSPGQVLIEPTVHFIFWIPPGYHLRPNGDANSDSQDRSVIGEFINDLGSTSYFNLVRQYCGSNGCPKNVHLASPMPPAVTTPYPRAGTAADPIGEQDVLTMLVNQLKSYGPNVGGLSNLYVVVLGSGVHLGKEFGYHSGGAIKGLPNQIVYAAISDPSPGIFGTSPNGVIDEYINTLAHEVMEAFSDPLAPLNPAWADPTLPPGKGEIGDKCIAFGYQHAPDNADLIAPNGHRYLVQQIWSNQTPATLTTSVGSCQMSSPAIVQLTPTLGPDGGGTLVEIMGGGFDERGGTSFEFGGNAASVSCQNSNVCYAVTPPSPYPSGATSTGTPTAILTSVDVTATVGGYTSAIARQHDPHFQIDLTTFQYEGAPCASALQCLSSSPPTLELTINCTAEVTFFNQSNQLLGTGTTYSTTFGSVPNAAVIACQCKSGTCTGVNDACTTFSTYDPNPQQCSGPPMCNGDPKPVQSCNKGNGWHCCGPCPTDVGNCGWICGQCQ